MKPTRADALQSRRLLLAAGAAAFAEHGIDVHVSEITRRAGLAKGTFFRHFPTKRALLVAILIESIHRHTSVAKNLMAEPTNHMVERFMTASAADMAPIRAVIENAIQHHVDDPSLHEAMTELLTAAEQLLAEARSRGEIRDDVTALDLQILLMAATSTSAHFFYRDTPDLWRRYLAITLNGLRPRAADPLPLSPPTWPAHPIMLRPPRRNRLRPTESGA
jgi:AcrR family transcriptional regulator